MLERTYVQYMNAIYLMTRESFVRGFILILMMLFLHLGWIGGTIFWLTEGSWHALGSAIVPLYGGISLLGHFFW